MRLKSKRRLGGLERQSIGLPGLTEPEVMRHYVRLSQKNFAIDAGIYSARLLHHEAQCAAEREDGPAAGLWRHSSVAATGKHRAGCAEADAHIGGMAS